MEEYRKFFLIKDVILNSINNKNLKSSIAVNLLQKKIEEIFGKKIKEYIKITKFLNNKLYVGCRHQGLVQSLLLNKQNILDKIRDEFDNNIKIKDIIFYFDSSK
ncbi:MAG TPA: DciA family protein [Spirochaetota bacterium]|nr:DciA family protein [Spirochaetota bacterium]HOL56010.1 DciA family protein [Spirochaetota bacterium]HPP03452.1 DciA family protein [Spirochaetota bacterium]